MHDMRSDQSFEKEEKIIMDSFRELNHTELLFWFCI